MATLTEPQKLLVVQRLACFYTPTEVQRELKELYALEIGLPTIMRYDPTTVQGSANLARKWQELFADIRARFIEDAGAIAISHRSFRLRKLNDMLVRVGEKNTAEQRAILEQAAKEAGGIFTNRLKAELSGPNGGPVEVTSEAMTQATQELAEWRKRMHQELEAGGVPGAPPPPPGVTLGRDRLSE